MVEETVVVAVATETLADVVVKPMVVVEIMLEVIVFVIVWGLGGDCGEVGGVT